MATVTNWNPFGAELNLTATSAGVTRISATQYQVKINVSWETYWAGNKTWYKMEASSGGKTVVLHDGSSGSEGSSGTLTGTYSISGNGAASKTVTVTFKNGHPDKPDIYKTQKVSFSVNVPAWTSYTVSYNANGGSGAPSSQTKWKDQTLTLSTTKPTRTGYTFQGWATSASGSVAYAAGASYTANASVTLYAVWKAKTYTVSYNANGGSGAPSSQTKTHGTALTLSTTKPTRANYTFLGWATSASATTATYAAGGSYTANATVTLYAVWELVYVKPIIYNLTADRCDASGAAVDDGTCGLIKFGWECTNTVSSIKIAWASASAGSGSTTVTASGTSGSVSKVIGDSSLINDASYTITVQVSDNVSYSTATTTFNGSVFPLDAKAGGNGIAFGKSAELGAADSLGGNGVADFAFDAKFNDPVYGKALGMDRLPAIPANGDFNNYMEPGCYAVYSNAIAETVANIPVARAGRLEVWSSTGEGVRLEQWSYLRQRFIPYNSGNAVWERELTRGEDNSWNYYEWWRSSLTPDISEKVYSKAAMTIALSANTVLGAVNTYTRIPFDKTVLSTNSRLTLSSNSIRIGSNIQHVKVNCQTLISPGSTDGLRHLRIQKVSGSTTTSVAWNTINIFASKHTLLTLTPIIVSVKEGDLLCVVFYTGNENDSISSGTTTNGWQTYLTVEEL
jgi:uncharacterized repeat protein (TIGR02543 family)